MYMTKMCSVQKGLILKFLLINNEQLIVTVVSADKIVIAKIVIIVINSSITLFQVLCTIKFK